MLLLPPRTVSATNAGLVNNPPAALLVAMSPREATAAAKRRDDAMRLSPSHLRQRLGGNSAPLVFTYRT